ncbi:MAG TPA: UDP-N-acetylglucosamine 2-epimerase (non-hydrolyzing) [Candidatus Atribacteria bacterium]|nr:UDP-N-acetylglucosamine 2-epimerase (non-hydrolyzing) [Candidatus Atribacteria bacterium]
MKKAKTFFILGTRPEVVKLAPVISSLSQEKEFEVKIINTGQHRDMAGSFLCLFGLSPHYNLDVMTAKQSLFYLTSQIIKGLEEIFSKDKPDLVIVQGDTTSAFCGALSAFYSQINCAHVEAGLRTGEKYSPFPEEMNRVLITRLADLHFAPTPRSRENLLREGIEEKKIYITGNTIVDTLFQVLEKDLPFQNEILLQKIGKENNLKIVTVTAHRRENWETGIEEVAQALQILGEKFPEIKIFFPLHPNPVVRDKIIPHLCAIPQVFLLEPLNYFDFVKLLSQSSLLITDSGGVQEEASALGIPVLITRDFTERPEVVEAGIGHLVGCNREKIVSLATQLLEEGGETKSQSIFGDGQASWRITQILRSFLKLDSSEFKEFTPQ